MRVLRLRRVHGLREISRRRTRNAQVNGSNPFAGSIFFRELSLPALSHVSACSSRAGCGLRPAQAQPLSSFTCPSRSG